MPADRDGPALTVAGSCAGCKHFHNGSAHTACTHKDVCGYHVISRRSTMRRETPAWCPLLPAARVALGRELAKEGEA